MKLPANMQLALERVDAMSLRERALLAGALFAVLFLAWDAFLMRPLNALQDARSGQIESLQEQVNDLNRAIQETVAGTVTDPDTEARRQLAELHTTMTGLDERLTRLTRDLVDPAQMPDVLERLLANNAGLELVSMRNLEARSIGNGAYFQHGIELEIEGGYNAVLGYLQALERLQWRFMWGSVELVVDVHPRSRTRIVLHTLSLHEGLLGV